MFYNFYTYKFGIYTVSNIPTFKPKNILLDINFFFRYFLKLFNYIGITMH